jgi:hypothetical protein
MKVAMIAKSFCIAYRVLMLEAGSADRQKDLFAAEDAIR